MTTSSDPLEMNLAVPDEEAQIREFALALQANRPWMTWGLLAVMVAMFGLEMLWGDQDMRIIGRMGAAQGELLRAGEYWRLVSPTFLHLSFTHILANGFALYSLGPFVEAVFGRRRFLIAFMAAAIGGNLLVALVSPQQMAAGASGAIWGLMTLAFALVLRPQGLLPPALAVRMRPRMWRSLLINVGISFIPGISLLAHFGGGAAGLALGFLPAFRRGLFLQLEHPERKDPGWAQALAWVSGLAIPLCLMVGIVHGKPWETLKPPELVPTQIGDTGLIISLPQLAPNTLQVEPQKNGAAYRFGSFNVDPAMVEVTLVDLPAELSSEQANEQLTHLRDALERKLKEEHVSVTFGPVLEMAGRPALHYELSFPKVSRVVCFTTILGKRVVYLRYYFVDSAAPDWKGLARQIYESLRPASQ